MCIRLVSCIYVSLIVITNEIKIGRVPSTNYFWKLIIQLADENYENGLNFNTPDTRENIRVRSRTRTRLFSSNLLVTSRSR